MLVYLRSATFLALALDAHVGADARPHALLAHAPDAVMRAHARSAAFPALALLALVGADARPHALRRARRCSFAPGQLQHASRAPLRSPQIQAENSSSPRPVSTPNGGAERRATVKLQEATSAVLSVSSCVGLQNGKT